VLVILNDSDECLIIYSSKNNTSVDTENPALQKTCMIVYKHMNVFYLQHEFRLF